MNREILTEVGGFTPVIDSVADNVGLIPAAVYGAVWRYCQMKDGVCTASVETIGKRVGISGRTITRHLIELVKNGYLEDMTPGLRNKPHTYRDTGKVKIAGKFKAEIDNEANSTMTNCHSKEATMTESHTRYDKLSERTMTDCQEKILIEDTIKDTATPKKRARKSSEQPIDSNGHFVALAETCDTDLKVATKEQRNMIGVAAKVLREAGATPQDITGFRAWWNTEDWRGKKGQAPTPSQVRTEWGKYKKSNGGNGSLKVY